MSSILTIRVSDDIKNSLDQLAEATGRSKSFLAFEAIKQYLDVEAWQVSEIKKGLAEIEVGEFISHDEVVKQWKQRHADSLVKKS